MDDLSSDKHYWHRYTETYEAALQGLGQVDEILEIGVLRGRSIAWLAKRFPQARIVGVDILAQTPEWPVSGRTTYVQLDQGDRAGLRKMYAELGRQYDLIVEDGSHLPEHQAISLTEGMHNLRPGGLYVLEDIHTSHPGNASFANANPGKVNSLHVLLAIEHLKARGLPLTPALAGGVCANAYFSPDELLELFSMIGNLHMYRRSHLPLSCYSCGGDSFDYARWRCQCGVELFSSTDSMSFLVYRALDGGR